MTHAAPPQRLAKWIAQSGHCSRRAAERLITQQRVNLNGEVARHTDVVCVKDAICIDDIPLQQQALPQYLLYHKPVGIDCNNRPQDPASLYHVLATLSQRLFAVGRLDKDSSGLLLLTNDGALSQRLMHPAFYHEKDYLVQTDKPLTTAFISSMASGVSWQLGANIYQSRPCRVIALGQQQFQITLTQGLHRQIRYMCKSQGYRVVSLQRIRLHNLQLGNLATGALRELTAAELTDLHSLGTLPQPKAQ